MDQSTKANAFKALHKKNDPIILYNIWDAGSAKAVVKTGAKAIATGSWSVAAAHGYKDGEAMPLDFVLQIAERIVATVDVPVTLDFEGGYAIAPEDVAANVAKVIDAGVIGINFEDRIVGGEGLHSTATQVERITAIRQIADAENIDFFINARTDLFLGSDPKTHEGLVDEAIAREAAYAAAGASGFFIPGLANTDLIKKITDAASLPVNVLLMGKINSVAQVSELGVSRLSFGPGPYVTAMADLEERHKSI